MHQNSQAELWRLFVISLLIALFGTLTKQWVLSLLVGFGGYALWQVYQMYRLETWLHSGGKASKEALSGIWLHAANKMAQSRKRDRKRKKALSRLVQRFHRTMEAMPDAAVIMEKGYLVEWYNQAAQRMLGLSPGKKKSAWKMDALDSDRHLRTYLKVGDFSEPLVMRSPVEPAVELEIKVIPFGQGQLLMLAHDITEARRVQAVRRDFIADVSHELRTPLTVITGYMELLEHEALDDSVTQALIASRRQAERMQRIVTDLLMLSRLELGEVMDVETDTVDVEQMLKGLTEDARRLSSERHRITLKADAGLQIQGSEAELSSAFGNLLFNAINHTPQGTAIHTSWGESGEGAALVVEDQGPGIAPEHLQRLTERFYRVDKGRSRAKGGTGLGLSIVKHVMHRHAATITIESELGRGTRFICEFPAAAVIQTQLAVAD